jgi:hypothetical protein
MAVGSEVSLRMSSSEIRKSTQECLEQFRLLISISTELGSADKAVGDSVCIEDQFARFRMWAGNIGAFAEGHASLDYRLRDNEKTHECMLNFLVALTDFVNRGECPSYYDVSEGLQLPARTHLGSLGASRLHSYTNDKLCALNQNMVLSRRMYTV